MQIIKKAVIPVAGMGTRFLPATKSIPKEMMPLGDLPAIHHIVEEAVLAGMTEILLVTTERKAAIKHYFSGDQEIDTWLEGLGKSSRLDRIEALRAEANIHYVNQPGLDGLGDAVFQAREFIGNEPFGVLLGDAVMLAETPVMGQMAAAWHTLEKDSKPGVGNTVIGAAMVPEENVSRYGIIEGELVGQSASQSDRQSVRQPLHKIQYLVEKPGVGQTSSRMAISGRYILPPEIFDCLAQTGRGKGNEIQLTDAIRQSLHHHQAHALVFDGKRYDIGNKFSYLEANIMFGLKDSDMKPALVQLMRDLVG